MRQSRSTQRALLLALAALLGLAPPIAAIWQRGPPEESADGLALMQVAASTGVQSSLVAHHMKAPADDVESAPTTKQHSTLATILVGCSIAVVAVAFAVLIGRMAPSAEGGFGSRSIGLLGGTMLIANNTAGPTISLMPGLTQEAGWLPCILVMVTLAFVSAVCGNMLLDAVRRMPGNWDFSERVEFADILKHYLHPVVYCLGMCCFTAYLILTLMTYIIQTSQVIDYAFLDGFGCAFGLDFTKGFRCGTVEDSSTPFGDGVVLSVSLVLLAVMCGPMASKNLDDSIVAQVVAMGGLVVLAFSWLGLLCHRADFPTFDWLPAATPNLKGLISTMLFNFAFLSSLPSWACEKKPEVSVNLVFFLSLSFVVVIYTTLGIVGALALPPPRHGENLFSQLNNDGGFSSATVLVYPILQNFTSIPVFAIILRYNVMRLTSCGVRTATVIAFGVPWLLSVLFYTGKGFQNIAEFGGLTFSAIVNFGFPVLLFFIANVKFPLKEDAGH